MDVFEEVKGIIVDLLEVEPEAVTLEAFHHPVLPERPRSIQLSCHYACGQLPELFIAARSGQRRVTHVVVEIELPVINPDGVILERDPFESLAVPRYQMHDRLGGSFDRLYVDATILRPERAGLEDLRSRHVHVHAGSLGNQEGVVLRGKPLVAVSCHGTMKRTNALL